MKLKSRSTKLPYVPGVGRLSSVSEAIRKDYGTILSRRERRRIAKEQEIPFKPYYNVRG